MRTNCPHCGAELDVSPNAVEATCAECGRAFSVLAEAKTLAGPPAPPSGSADAPTVVKPKLRVNCAECNGEFTIPMGEDQAPCPHCGASFSLAETGRRTVAAGPTLHSARTVVTGREAAPPAPAAAEAPAAAGTDEASLRWMRTQFGDHYEIVDFVSRGGMGAVYRARQKRPSRDVALKVMLAGAFASPAHRKRFEREAQAVASLKHPAIVPVYEYGEAAGQPYFTMEFVEGADLRRYVRQNELSRQEICRLMVRVCDAIHYAHQRGVIHRDLKPTNVMVDSLGRPRILDFGLSRTSVQGDEQHSILTGTGDVMGTPRYMSPEQAMGQAKYVDERSDVYSLGVVLYELIVGVLPYPIEHVRGLRALDMLRTAKPLRPSALHPDMPRDLEIIMLKAIEKDPELRYPTAEALAQDLESLLASRPISARPPTVTYRLNKWAWRNRKVVFPLTAALLVILALASVSLLLRRQVGRLSDLEIKYRTHLSEARRVAPGVYGYIRQGKWLDAYLVADQGLKKFPRDADLDSLPEEVEAEAERHLGDEIGQFERLLQERRYDEARTTAAALTGLAMELPAAFRELKDRAAAVQPTFDESCWTALQDAAAAAYARERALAAVDGFIARFPRSPHLEQAGSLRDELAGKPDAHYVEQHGPAFAAAVGRHDWDAAQAVLDSAEAMLPGLGENEKGGLQEMIVQFRSRLAGVIRPESVERLTPLGDPRPHEGFVKSVAFAPDSSYVAVADIEGVLTRWSPTEGEPLGALSAGAPLRAVAVSPDGALLAVGGEDGGVTVRALPDGSVLRQWRVDPDKANHVTSLAFSPDGRLLLTADVHRVSLWQSHTGEPADGRPIGGRSPATFAPDGASVAAALAGTGAGLWRLPSGRPLRELSAGGAGQVMALAFSPDGRLLATGHSSSQGRKIRLWDARSGSIVREFEASRERDRAVTQRVWALAFSPDGKLLATGGPDKLLKLWDVHTGKALRELSGHTSWVTSAAFSPDGRFLASGGNDSRLLIWVVAAPAPAPAAD